MVRFIDLGPNERTEDAPAAGENPVAGAAVGAPDSAVPDSAVPDSAAPDSAAGGLGAPINPGAPMNPGAPINPGAPLNPWASAAEGEPLASAPQISVAPAVDTVARGAWGRVQEEAGSGRERAADSDAARNADVDAATIADPRSRAEVSPLAEVAALTEDTPFAEVTPLAEVSPLAARRRRRSAVASEATPVDQAGATPERECVVSAFPGTGGTPTTPVTPSSSADSAATPSRATPIAAFEEYPDSEIPTLAQRFGLDEDVDDDESAEYEPDPVDPEAVREDLVRRLARSALSQAEVVAEGIDRGLDPDQAEDARAWLEQLGYLDDAVLAEEMKHRLYDRKGKSRSVVAREMSMRKIDREIIDAVLADVADEDELQAALALAEKRAGSLRGLDRATAERRLNGFLARRGYTGSVVREAVSRALGPKSPVRFR